MVWKEAKDARGKVYYYNTVSKQSQWEKPAELLVLPPDWKSATTKEGKVYYYNVKTKKSQWTVPVEAVGTVGTVDTVDTVADDEQQLQKSTIDVLKDKEDVDAQSTYANKSELLNMKVQPIDVAETQFIEMLRSNNVDSTWSFSRIISELGTKDSRYWVIDNDPLWKQQMFEKYLSNRTEEQLLKEHSEINKFRDAFWEMLCTKESIHYYTNWSTAKRLISEEPIYRHSVVSEQEKKKSFHEYVDTLKEKYEKSHFLLKEQALVELRGYLQSIFETNTSSVPISWQLLRNNYLFENNKRYMANKHFSVLTHEDVLKEYIGMLQKIETELNAELIEKQSKNYTKDRLARDKFKELLTTDPEIKIRANSKWADVYPLIRNHPSFLNMLGRNGSNAVDLFMDIVEEKYITVCGQRSIAQQVLIDEKFEWHENDTSDNESRITTILLNNEQFKDIDKEDMTIIVKQIIDIRETKLVKQQQKELYMAEQRKKHFKTMLLRYYQATRHPPTTWTESRNLFSSTIEFQELDEQTRQQIFDTVTQEIHNTAKQTTPHTTSKKRSLDTATQLDY